MTPVEIQAMAKGVAEATGGNAQWIGYLVAAIAGGMLSYLGGYLAEKGKNRATKDDIKAITDSIEGVKAEYTRQMEQLRAVHQLRFVAAEKRLQAHQEAFTQWSEIMQLITAQRREDALTRLEDFKTWHSRSNVYLAPNSRAQYDRFVGGVSFFLQAILNPRPQDAVAVFAAWTEMQNVGSVFLVDVDLPALSQRELEAYRPPIEAPR